MNLKNKSYMNGKEFKDRQGSFEFFCAQAYEFLKAFRNECRRGWRKLFQKPEKLQTQLALDFMRSIAEWASWAPEKNRDFFINNFC